MFIASVRVMLLFIMAVPMVCGCGSKLETKNTLTVITLNEVLIALRQYNYDGGQLTLSKGDTLADTNGILTEVLLSGGYLDEKTLAKRGLLGPKDESGRRVLLDAWGRPLVVQFPYQYPAGVVCRTAQGLRKVAPLEISKWDSRTYGSVQVWSLGVNGRDDRGEGDDLVYGRKR